MKPTHLLFATILTCFAAGCAAETSTDPTADESDSELTKGAAPSLADLKGEWSDYGVTLDKQIVMGLEIEAGGKFKATLATTCADDGRGLCGDPANGTYTYANGRLELTFTTGPKTPFVYTALRLSSTGVLSLYRDGKSGGQYVAGRLVKKLARTTCGGCQDVYTSCVKTDTAKACRTHFDQCIYDSATFKNFEFAGIDCLPREATDEVCKRAKQNVKDNAWRKDLEADARKYSKDLLKYYGISESDCPLP